MADGAGAPTAVHARGLSAGLKAAAACAVPGGDEGDGQEADGARHQHHLRGWHHRQRGPGQLLSGQGATPAVRARSSRAPLPRLMDSSAESRAANTLVKLRKGFDTWLRRKGVEGFSLVHLGLERPRAKALKGKAPEPQEPGARLQQAPAEAQGN